MAAVCAAHQDGGAHIANAAHDAAVAILSSVKRRTRSSCSRPKRLASSFCSRNCFISVLIPRRLLKLADAASIAFSCAALASSYSALSSSELTCQSALIISGRRTDPLICSTSLASSLGDCCATASTSP